MLRMLRVIGIIMFALLLGYAARTLIDMHEEGTLFDPYNSARKSGLTLATLSVLALAALGFFELCRLGNASKSGRYGERRYTDQRREQKGGEANSSIYTTPTPRDEWHIRKQRSGSHSRKSRSQPPKYLPGMWLTVLRVVCIAIPVVYVLLFAALYMQGFGRSIGPWVFSGIGFAFITLSVTMAIGVYRKKFWGLSLGYLLAIFNLILFPFGTVIGLFLLISLVGSTSAFAMAQNSQKRANSFI